MSAALRASDRGASLLPLAGGRLIRHCSTVRVVPRVIRRGNIEADANYVMEIGCE